MSNVSLAFEDREDRQHGVVREIVGKPRANFGDSRRPTLPEDCHDVELTVGEGWWHPRVS